MPDLEPLSRAATPDVDSIHGRAATPDLGSILSRAATPEAWSRVVQRCAWCQRVFDERGVRELLVAVDRLTVVTTDGMCPPCGARNLAQLAARQSRAA